MEVHNVIELSDLCNTDDEMMDLFPLLNQRK